MSSLDTPVWSALTGGHDRSHAGLALGADVGDGLARRYPADVCPFSALADVGDPAAWADLAELLGEGGEGVVPAFDPATGDRAPGGWTVPWSIPGVQLVAEALVPTPPGPDVVPLGEADVDDMLTLVELTRPGPFERRTRLLGTYLGVRDADGRLVAMAGERLHPAGFSEISAVCTHPDARGRGLGSRLVLTVAAEVRRRGDQPFLHAAAGNTSAIRLYEQLGFVLRRRTAFTAVRTPGAGVAGRTGE